MESLAEEFRKREAVKPDKWTMAWWRDQFAKQAKATRGATHAMHLALAEMEDRGAETKELRKQVEDESEELTDAIAKIGKLQAEVVKLQEAMGKSREVYSELKKKIAEK